MAHENSLPEIKGPGSADELLKGQIRLLKIVRVNAEQGKETQLSSKTIRKLLTELKTKNLSAYKKVRKLNVPVQRKLFLMPLLAALGIGGALGTGLSSALTPTIGSALGAGAGAALGIGAGAAILGASALGSFSNKKNIISELKREKSAMMGEVALVKMQFKEASAKLNTKFQEIENHVENLSEATKSRINMLNLWIDSRSLI